ncbi:MAG: hypothetical protein GY714_21505 [Desulfobacterales bacterium]|nr:hypothetical protein [Desulfobacterales bacterium]MCP4163349.1 hypothetical protein [Deltaproteobacteria bacterium]
MKMYILIKDSIPECFAILAAAHSSLAAYLKFEESNEIKEWLSGPFYKVICKVNEKEFKKAKEFDDNVILTESALENQEVAIAFKPRSDWPKPFKFYKGISNNCSFGKILCYFQKKL